MKTFARLALALGITCGLAAGGLAATYAATRDAIREREAAERSKALAGIFFRQLTDDGALALRVEPLTEAGAPSPVYALYESGDAPGQPSYYAALGAGTGYNAATPVETLVAFTNPARPARPLLEGYVAEGKLPAADEKGLLVVGWRTVKSQETPGLGEKIRDQSTAATWAGLLAGDNPPESPDRATPFQRQFRGRPAAGLRLSRDGGDVDALTAATYTTNGVMAALADAARRVEPYLPGATAAAAGEADAATSATVKH